VDKALSKLARCWKAVSATGDECAGAREESRSIKLDGVPCKLVALAEAEVKPTGGAGCCLRYSGTETEGAAVD